LYNIEEGEEDAYILYIHQLRNEYFEKKDIAMETSITLAKHITDNFNIEEKRKVDS